MISDNKRRLTISLTKQDIAIFKLYQATKNKKITLSEYVSEQLNEWERLNNIIDSLKVKWKKN